MRGRIRGGTETSTGTLNMDCQWPYTSMEPVNGAETGMFWSEAIERGGEFTIRYIVMLMIYLNGTGSSEKRLLKAF